MIRTFKRVGRSAQCETVSQEAALRAVFYLVCLLPAIAVRQRLFC